MKVKAHEIKHALSKKHERTNDFFLTEVKNGPTHTATELFIMDGLAIKKSWINPMFTGYEIKVSRSDFLSDEKWPAYLNYCHRLDFVCPTGMIQPNELPDDVGLIYYNPEKQSLHTRRKGKIRNIEMPYEMLYYIIMTRLKNEKHPFFDDRREYFQDYLADKINLRQLGYAVNSKLIEQMTKLQEEKESLQRRNERIKRDGLVLEEISKVLKKHGINHWYKDGFSDAIDEALSSSMPPNLLKDLETINNASGRLLGLVENN